MLEEALALVASAEVAADIDLERARLLAAAGRERAASELLRRAADVSRRTIPHALLGCSPKTQC